MMEKTGFGEFVKLISFADGKNKLENIPLKEMDIVWYPGCGGDISPCRILEEKNFEQVKGIETKGNRIYIFTDPDQYRACEKAYGERRKIYDRTMAYGITGYIEPNELSIEKIAMKMEDRDRIDGYYISFMMGDKECRIIYLKVKMQDFLVDVIKRFRIRIKWLFYVDMEYKGGNLFPLFKENEVGYPQWVCANRINVFGIHRYAKLLPMTDENGNNYYKDDNDPEKHYKDDYEYEKEVKYGRFYRRNQFVYNNYREDR